MMNKELWKLNFIGITLIYPPLPPVKARFTQKTLGEIFVKITQQYSYNRFAFIQKGATLEEEGKGRILMLEDRIQIEEAVESYYESYVEKFKNILAIIVKELGLTFFVVQINRLRALWEIEQDSGFFFLNKLMNLDPQKLQILCPQKLLGTGLKFVWQDQAKAEKYDLIIEPFYGTKSTILLQMDHHFMKPDHHLAGFRERIEFSYNIMSERTQKFLTAINGE
jgi:hypothetical protein